jgi:predicted  nucleic acid-binding Zn-ribbon protein
MAMPATKFELEAPLEDRVARLEVNVEHIQKDVSEMKTDIRRLNDKIEAVDHKLTAKIDAVDQRLTGKIDSLKDVVTALAINMEKGFAGVEKSFGALRTARALDRVWYLLMTGGILGIMARAFKWI